MIVSNYLRNILCIVDGRNTPLTSLSAQVHAIYMYTLPFVNLWIHPWIDCNVYQLGHAPLGKLDTLRSLLRGQIATRIFVIFQSL